MPCSTFADSAVCDSEALTMASTSRATVLASVESLCTHRSAKGVDMNCNWVSLQHPHDRSAQLHQLRVQQRMSSDTNTFSLCLLFFRGRLIVPKRQAHPEALIEGQHIVRHKLAQLRQSNIKHHDLQLTRPDGET